MIVTLYSGEQELASSTRSLEEQTFTNWHRQILRDLPNIEAHRRLYDLIMESRREFDLFVKLDADMVFERRTALSEIVEVFQRTRELDHAIFSVSDWASKQAIMGLHAYSNRVQWLSSAETLFVDPRPNVPGQWQFVWQAPAPVAKHMPDPSVSQAYVFGYHRALKVVQRGRFLKDVDQAEMQLNLLRAVWRAYESSRDPRRALVLFGAEDAFASKEKVLVDKIESGSDDQVRELWRQSQANPYKYLSKRWSAVRRPARWRKFRWTVLPRYSNYLLRIARVGPRMIGRLKLSK